MVYKKKLIEVGIPLEIINKAAYKENRKLSNPKKIHVYFARRKYSAARAIIFSQIVDDPSSNIKKFPTEASQDEERERLFKIISELVKWENFNNSEVLEKAYKEMLKSSGNQLPKICDAFSGSGLISLEAQRLGFKAIANDLNPVAYLITKATIEIPSLFKDKNPVHSGSPNKLHYQNAEGLAEDVEYYANLLLKKVFKKVGHLYPDVNSLDGKYNHKVITWIWARTVPSPDPAFAGIHVPLARTFLLSSKKNMEAFIKPIIDKKNKKISYEVINGGTHQERLKANEGTKIKDKTIFRCLLSEASIDSEYIKEKVKRNEFSTQLIGIIGAKDNSNKGQVFLPPSEEQSKIANVERGEFEDDIEISDNFNIKKYGFKKFSELFTDRQLKTLTTFVEELHVISEDIENDIKQKSLEIDGADLVDFGTGNKAYIQAIKVYLGFLVDQLAHHCSSACTWHTGNSQLRNIFNKPTITPAWDFAEINPFSGRTGSFQSMLKGMIGAFTTLGTQKLLPEVVFGDACDLKYDSSTVISTDPPYYDNIGYADLSDFFYLWMKKCLKDIYPNVFRFKATPKADELVVDASRHGSKKVSDRFFIDGMTKVIRNMSNYSSKDFPACIYYAYAGSEKRKAGISAPGWVSFLTSVIDAGFSIVATWPVRLEQKERMTANGKNSLATSLLIICRRLEDKTQVITEGQFIEELKDILPKAIKNLKTTNIAPADLPQCSIGPGIGVFTKYKKILQSDDTSMSVKKALQLINRELSDSQNEYDEITNFVVQWFSSFGFRKKPFDQARIIAQASGLTIPEIISSGVAETSVGNFNLISRTNLNLNWNPVNDRNLTVWECCQYLIHYLNTKGLDETSDLFHKIKSIDLDLIDKTNLLAYELYEISINKLFDANEAAEYNNLITNWLNLNNKNKKNENNQFQML